jgi:2-polyprenyl-3-methyl-5-hydroxy-6-metoxy-1,4-benzoquinol methylase
MNRGANTVQRILENEVMDSPAEALAYDSMDHQEVNTRFVDDLLAAVGPLKARARVVDLGTGTAQIPIELCRRAPHVTVTGIDAAESMLDVGRRNLAQHGFIDRVELVCHDAKVVPTELGQFEVVMSNSLVHHLPEPEQFFDVALMMVAPGGSLFVRDLFRPATEGEWVSLVATYAADAEPEQRQMFADSLQAALTVDEVRDIVARHGFDRDTVAATSDRHWTWIARPR